MIKFICSEPKTYFCNQPVKILDENKNYFYSHENKEKHINFNLPVGTYYTSNDLLERKFDPYVLCQNANFPFSINELKIIVENNSHTATINPIEKTITVDPKTARINFLPALTFLMLHEVYHLICGGSKRDVNGNIIFDAEKACDSYATKYMLANGWNPLQVYTAKELLLSSPERKKCLDSQTINLNHRR